MKHTLTVVLYVGLAAGLAGPVAAEPIVINPLKVGVLQWNLANGSVNAFGGSRVLVTERDVFPPVRNISYTLWDLSPVNRPIASGNVQGTLGTGPHGWYATESNDQAQETFRIRDLSLDLDLYYNLRTDGFFINGGNFCTDITTGSIYGDATATPAGLGKPFSVALYWRGVQDINTAAGTVMGMGFHPTSGPREAVYFHNPRLVLYPFNDPVSGGGGIDFILDNGTISTDGTVDLTPRGCKHHLSAYAADQQLHDAKVSEVRRKFQFDAGGSNDPRLVYLLGDLHGELSAGDANATARATMRIFRADGTLLDETSYFEEVGTTILGQWQNSTITETMMLEVELVPGETYEVLSRLELTADLDGPLGSAMASFLDTFDVELSGVPEPATLALLALGGLGVLLRRRRK